MCNIDIHRPTINQTVKICYTDIYRPISKSKQISMDQLLPELSRLSLLLLQVEQKKRREEYHLRLGAEQ